MISSKLGAIAFIAAMGVASPAFAQRIHGPSYVSGRSAGGYNNLIAIDYTYNPRPGWPIRDPNPWANDYRLKHHQMKHHLPSKAQ
jgi:hypothetical protein